MAKIDLNTVSSGYLSQAALNANFTAIEDEFQDKVLYRDNPTGEPNSMATHLDMNGFNILNAGNAAEIGLVDADDVSFIPSGTNAVSRSVGNKLRDTVSVKDFGAVGDGVADDTAAIQAAIDSQEAANGGILVFPVGTYRVSSTLTINASNVLLQGEGGDRSHDVGIQGASASTKLVWAGTVGGTVVQFASPIGASAQKQSGGGMVRFFIQCAGSAAIGIQLVSWDFGVFQNIAIINPATAGIDIDVAATLGEARDSQNNKFSQISVRCVEGAAANACVLRVNGDATANTSLNMFEEIDGTFLNGTAFLLKNSDNNLFLRCRAFRASGGTGASIEFQGSDASSAETARTNIFLHFTSNATPIARGTTSYTYASTNNSLLLLDQDNATPVPTVETGATVFYTRTDNVAGMSGIVGVAAGESVTAVGLAKSRRTSTSSLWLYNGSEDHMELDDGTNKWGIRLASGRFTISRFAGTGGMSFPTNTISDYADDVAAAAGGVPVGGVYRTGSVLKARIS